MSDITGYQPRAQAAALVRVRGRGPRSHELRRLLDRWLKARAKDRDLTDELRARDRGFRQALAERDEALADLDEAELDGQPADAKKVKRLEARVDEAERARDKVVRRITAWRPRLVAAETAAAHFAERHADEINAETLPSLAQAEQRFRDALTQLQAASQRLDDEVMAVDAIQGVVQGAQRVLSGGGDVGQLLTLVGRVQAQPLMRLPDTLAVLAEEAGMFTTVNEGGRMIPANLGRPGGPVDVNALQAAQARRIDELAAQEA